MKTATYVKAGLCLAVVLLAANIVRVQMTGKVQAQSGTIVPYTVVLH